MDGVIVPSFYLKMKIKIMSTTRFDKAIELHKRHSRIYFSEVRENEQELVVAVRQTRAPNGVYLDRKQLEEISREVYALKPDFNKKLIVNTAPYSEAPSEIVSPEWVQDQMNRRKLGLKGIVEATGISKSDLSAMINGHKEMGIRTKGLFYYFFKSLDIMPAIDNESANKIKELEQVVSSLSVELSKKSAVTITAKRNASRSSSGSYRTQAKTAKKGVAKKVSNDVKKKVPGASKKQLRRS